MRLRLVHRVADASELTLKPTPLSGSLELHFLAFAQHARRRRALSRPTTRCPAAACARAAVAVVVLEVTAH